MIAMDEWRYWFRSKLVVTMMVVALVLAVASVITTGLSLSHESHERSELQNKAEQAFESQPDRHPHRMVHYGHYVFRTPAPLSTIDPGIDSYTGTSIFLEGHQQNTAMFSEQGKSSGLTRFSQLTPAFVMQIIVPLLLILIGYSMVSRERENGTLTFIIIQGVSLNKLMFGKFIALLMAGFVALLPLIIGSAVAVTQGEALSVVLSFILAHGLYVVIWCALVVFVSTLNTKNSSSFSILVTLWIVLCIVAPRIAASTASSMVASPSKLEADFEVIREAQALGGGHNVSSADLSKLKANLMAQYDVDDEGDLPVNIRGIVASKSEADLTKVLNRFAEKRMSEELSQAQIARQFGWLTPVLSLRTASMMLAGTNLETHHRFLREAEILRYDFVQSLNKVHAEKLSYNDDVNRYKNSDANNKAKVTSKNWEVLESFSFTPDTATARLMKSIEPLMQLFAWILVLLILAYKTRKVM
ncbi:DUF3526 domain-containing protein [Psychrosphaera haliotis]|uniref:DUF3526 domain-containing protein n=1 Tax=Psychrosphaera haliotis TaxID=555083 RepID=A0A6N8F8B2_9GAMM|nr:DUF3526 domain-containing protein [Psychrosphaera haliotis]MUH72815.1 DUF3526 domain-containing protein [Psychrosphaera haliotis]